jgi:hypothetical protein
MLTDADAQVTEEAAGTAAQKVALAITGSSGTRGSTQGDKDVLLRELKELQASMSINDACAEILKDRTLKLMSRTMPGDIHCLLDCVRSGWGCFLVFSKTQPLRNL